MLNGPIEAKSELGRVANPEGPYRAIEVTPNGWCMVVGPIVPEHAGPWRYLWEAQDYADDLNAARSRVRP